MYIISGHFKVMDNYRDELIKISLKLVPLSKNETGCISYGFFEDQFRPGHFLFLERWDSRKAIDEHFEKTYFKDFAERFPQMIDGEAVIDIHEIRNTEKL